jgi:transposase
MIQNLNKKASDAEFNGDIKALKRVQVMLMINEGNKFETIALILKISKETIRLWIKDFLLLGIRFLKYQKSPGRPPKLTKSQKKQLAKIIDDGPEKKGFSSACWRTPMVQKIIQEEFGVTYSCFYLSALLKNMGYSYQKATFVSAKRDHEIRKIWITKIWPQILKEANRKKSYILFGDECSFTQGGTLNYTWAKRGVQPEIKTSGSKRCYKVFGAIEYFSGKFFSMTYDGKLNTDSYTLFLEGILSQTKKHIIIIQDGAGYHTSDEMEDLFCGRKNRLSVYQLPACSPDYNPIEMLWKKIKEKGTHLKYFPTFDSLANTVDEMLIKFVNCKKEIMSLFGLYDKLPLINRF